MKKLLFSLINIFLIMSIISCTTPSSDATSKNTQGNSTSSGNSSPSAPSNTPGTPSGPSADPGDIPDSPSPDNTQKPSLPPATGELSDFINTIYAGERNEWKEGENNKFVYIIFDSAISNKKLPVKIGSGLTFDQAKAMAMGNQPENSQAAVNVPFLIQISNGMTLYIDNDLQSGYTTTTKLINNESFHVRDLILNKQ